jgi:carbon monoxide dehydrogenase subunit G
VSDQHFEGTHVFSAARAVVWKLLLDPDVLTKTMPGATSIIRISDERYEGNMRVGIGPFTAAEFAVTIAISDRQEPDHYTMEIDAQGRFGHTRGKAVVTLTEDGVSTTMHYRADMEVGGTIAVVGRRVLDSLSQMMLRQGLDAMSAELTRRLSHRPS